MVAHLPIDPYLIYLDNTALVDLAIPTEPRHREAQALLNLVQKHQQSGMLQLRTSAWTIAEAHGVLYKKELEKPQVRATISHNNYRRELRNVIPPRSAQLKSAGLIIDPLVQTLQGIRNFRLLPDIGSDHVGFWQLEMQLAREAAIWPADSVHVAMALQSGCSMFITDDEDLLDKIECCQKQIIQPYRHKEFSQIPNLPPFCAHGIRRRRSIISNRQHSDREPSAQVLRQMGFL